MTDSRVAYCKIHPSIGIARVGNSPDGFFIGPEIPGAGTTPVGGYKDKGDMERGIPPRIKRQAARFRIFAYDDKHQLIGEITSADAEITWTVHLVNSKAEGDNFIGLSGEELEIGDRKPRADWRNRDIDDRKSLIIDPGPRTVSAPGQKASFDGGKFRGVDVPLGDVRMDELGRLLILGGFGMTSSTNPGQPITNYANNDLWHDDVSDGPVTATVRLKASGQVVAVEPAWVAVAPPDFAPGVTSVVTLFDVAVDVALRSGLRDVPGAPPDRPSFTMDIAPIFDRLSALQWVQQGARGAGQDAVAFADLDALADADDDTRSTIFARFRNPHLDPASGEAKLQATAEFLPALSGDMGDTFPGRPLRWLALTRTQYDTLQKWSDGEFENDWIGAFPDAPSDITPSGLDRAALEAASGGAFYPGIEGGWILRNPKAYAEPIRLAHAVLKPGYVTRHMACPWQADFFECSSSWWPAQRPDEVLTLDAYRRIREIEEVLADSVATAPDVKRLEREKARLMAERSPWARGLPQESPEGDVAMIESWARNGFVVAADGGGEPFVVDGMPVLVETERGRYDGLPMSEYFHLLTNIEQHPDFLPKARELAYGFLRGADYDADDFYQPFDYSPEAFDQRMKDIYEAFVADMESKSPWDTGEVAWPVVVRYEGDLAVTKLKLFGLTRFSDRALKEGLRQRAPFNLIDGAWLQRIQAAGPADEIRAHLFSIWDDEAGNGRASQNHCNVYDTLLRSLGFYLPPITSRKFIEQDFIPGVFVSPVFQLCVGLFPDEFYPELLGMTLYLEWEATPTLTPNVRLYRGRGIDPHFYQLHVAIDNITAGHGYLAMEAIKLYLQKVEDEGGDKDVQQAWQRIWRGYVTWATLGSFGRDLTELFMIIDHKQIDLSYPAMLTVDQIKDPAELVARLKAAARKIPRDPVSSVLVAWFREPVVERLRTAPEGQEPVQDLVSAVVDELNRLVQSTEIYDADVFKDARLGEDVKELLKRPVEGEDLVNLNRLLLRDGYAGVIGDIPKLEPQWFPDYRAHYRSKFVELIKRKAYAAKPVHRDVVIGGQNLASLFDSPEALVDAITSSPLVNIEHPRSSRFFDLTSFSGPMYKIFTDAELSIILDWIESLREKAPEPSEPQPTTPQDAAQRLLDAILKRQAAAAAVPRHADETVLGRSLKDWFSDPSGMMKAFAEDPKWVRPGDSGASRLYREFANGEMAFLRDEAKLVKQWIDLGAVAPVGVAAAPDAGLQGVVTAERLQLRVASQALEQLSEQTVKTAASVAPAKVSPRRDFPLKRMLIGTGSVH